MSNLSQLFVVLFIWASIVSPLSSQGPPDTNKSPPPDLAKIPQGKNFVIKVGGDAGEKVFNPPTVRAKVGDTVTFEYHPKAHTVSQSTFENPCEVPSGPQGTGFSTETQAVEPKTANSNLPRWTIQILVPEPIWFHCLPHCGIGMVGAINPPTSGDRTFEKYVENAKKAAGAKNLRAGGTPPEQPSKTGPSQLATSRAAGEKPAPGSFKTGGQSGTLQQGPTRTADEVAAIGANSASVEGKDANTLASKGKDAGSGAGSMMMRRRKSTMASISLSLIIPGVLLNTIY